MLFLVIELGLAEVPRHEPLVGASMKQWPAGEKSSVSVRLEGSVSLGRLAFFETAT